MKIFEWKGIPVKIHWMLPLFLIVRIFSSNNPVDFHYNLAFAVLVTFSVIVHEFGHALTARKLGGRAHEIVLWPLGGLAYTSGHRSLKDQLKTTLGGPLTHIPLALLFAGIAFLLGAEFTPAIFAPSYAGLQIDNFWASVFVIGVKTNMYMFLLNMFLPAYPLDCGHIIAESLLLKGKSPEVVAKVLIGFSTAAGLFLLLYLRYPILTIWVFYETYRLADMLKKGIIRQHPVFAVALASPVRSRPKFSVVVSRPKKGLRCPTCLRELNPGAKMCGFCEKPI